MDDAAKNRHAKEGIAIATRLGLVKPRDEEEGAIKKALPAIEALALAEELSIEDRATPAMIVRCLAGGADVTDRILQLADAGTDLSKARATLYRLKHQVPAAGPDLKKAKK